MPAADPRAPGDVAPRLRQELETFFRTVTVLTQKDVAVVGWGTARDADALVERSRT